MDQEFQEEPRPKLPPPIPAALPSPVPVAPLATAPGAAPDAQALATTVVTPGPELAAAGAPPPTSSTSEPSAAAAVEQDALPRLEPIPGTVARNTPKSG
jgi:sec-independent protein translocase protein TatB